MPSARQDAPRVATLLPAIRLHRSRLGLACGLAVLRTVSMILRPWPLAFAVDHALDPQGADGLPAWLAGQSAGTLLVAAAVSSAVLTGLLGVLDMAIDRVAEGTAERIGATLRGQLFERSLTRSLRFHDRMRSGELVSRLTTDVGRVLDAVVGVTTTLLPDSLLLLGVVLLLLGIDDELALVALSVVPILGVFALYQRRRVRAAQLAARTASGQLVATSADLFRNVRAVQAFGRLERAGSVFAGRNEQMLDADLDAVVVEARWSPVADTVLAVGTGLALVVGGQHVLSGALSVGTLLVVLAYLRDLYAPVRSLTRLSTLLAKAGASLVRLAEVLESEETVPEPAHPRSVPDGPHTVVLDGVRFGYEPGRPVLDGVDLVIGEGETVCLLGPSGSGKSTLLSLILRLYDVDHGQILLDGVDLRDLSLEGLRSHIAYLPQEPWLLDATVAENIAFGSRHASRHGVLAAGRAAVIDEFVADLPAGYDTVVGEGGVRLSGGQRRRVALARAIVSGAGLLLLDEPTASLDPDSAGRVTEAVRAAVAGRTALVVTHDPQVAALADRVLQLDSLAHPETTDLVSMGRR